MNALRTFIAAMLLMLAMPVVAQPYVSFGVTASAAHTRPLLGVGYQFTAAALEASWQGSVGEMAAIFALSIPGPKMLIGKIGAYRTEESTTTNAEKFSEWHTRLLLGLGMQIEISNGVRLRALAEREQKHDDRLNIGVTIAF